MHRDGGRKGRKEEGGRKAERKRNRREGEGQAIYQGGKGGGRERETDHKDKLTATEPFSLDGSISHLCFHSNS